MRAEARRFTPSIGSKKGETGPAMPIGAALTRMTAAAPTFNVGAVRERDLALVAAVAPSE